jgi:CheY-like chemotaxis protein
MVREMKASKELSGIPIILMSAVSEAMVRDECEFTAFLRKPFDLDTLFAAVSSLIGPG